MRWILPVGVALLALSSGCDQKPPANVAPPAQQAVQMPGPPVQMPGPPVQMPGPPATGDANTVAQAPTVPAQPAAPPTTPAIEAPTPQQSPEKPTLGFTEAQLREISIERMKKIGLALHNHMDRNNDQFPPAYVADASGKPLYSWRVSLLPYLGQQALYNRFDKTKAWDAPENIEVSNTALDVFKSPHDSSVAPNGANFLAIVGPGHFFQGPKGISLRDMRDGFSETVVAVEIRGVAGSWAAPIDLKTSAAWKLGTGAGELNSVHPKFLSVLMGDAKSKIIREEDLNNVMPAALGIQDGIKVSTF